jgi:hypothetical protein
MERRLSELERLRKEGQMGLSDAERQSLEASLATQRGAALRQAETLSTQRAQAAGGSGRELFLAEMAGSQAEQEARMAGAEIIAQQEAAARQAQQAEMMNLAQQEAAAKAGVVSALTGGLFEGGQTALNIGMQAQAQQAEFEFEAEMERQRVLREAVSSGLMSPDEFNAFMDTPGGANYLSPRQDRQSQRSLRRTSTTE